MVPLHVFDEHAELNKENMYSKFSLQLQRPMIEFENKEAIFLGKTDYRDILNRPSLHLFGIVQRYWKTA